MIETEFNRSAFAQSEGIQIASRQSSPGIKIGFAPRRMRSAGP
ncbi:MAG: hypothetical protein AAF328_07855 [Planctomycetota bacterium]